MPFTTSENYISAIQAGDVATVLEIEKSVVFQKYDTRDAQGNSPIHIAAQIEDPVVRDKMLAVMISAGVPIDLVNNAGEKPQHYETLIALKARIYNREQRIDKVSTVAGGTGISVMFAAGLAGLLGLADPAGLFFGGSELLFGLSVSNVVFGLALTAATANIVHMLVNEKTLHKCRANTLIL